MVIKILIQKSLSAVKGAWLSFESKLQATEEGQALAFHMFMKTRMVWLTCYWKWCCYLAAFPDCFDSDTVWQRADLQFLKCKFATYEQLCSKVFLSSSMCNFVYWNTCWAHAGTFWCLMLSPFGVSCLAMLSPFGWGPHWEKWGGKRDMCPAPRECSGLSSVWGSLVQSWMACC